MTTLGRRVGKAFFGRISMNPAQNTTTKNRVREIAGSRLGSNFTYLMSFARTRVLRETYWEHGRVSLIGYVLGNEVSGM
jgi:hypothetical protein